MEEYSIQNQNCENHHQNQHTDRPFPIPKSQASIKNKLYKSEMLRKAYRGCLEAVQLHLSPRNELHNALLENVVKFVVKHAKKT